MHEQEVLLELKGLDDRTVGHLRILAPDRHGLVPPLVVLDEEEAAAWCEQPVQLLEGVSYDYEMRSFAPGLRMRTGILRKSRLSEDFVERGRIEPGLHTGVLSLVIEDLEGNEKGKSYVEVRSSKLGYREDYRSMLNDIAAKAVDLLLDLKSPSSNWLKTLESLDAPSLIQRYFFIRHLLDDAVFHSAVGEIVRRPHESTSVESVERHVGRGIKLSGMAGRWIAAGQPRQPVPRSHALHSVVPSIPRTIPILQTTPTLDNHENHFVKFALSSFQHYLLAIETGLAKIEKKAQEPLIRECQRLRQRLASMVSSSFLRDLPESLTRLPSTSTVLQRKSGYRELFRVWGRFNTAAQLSWDGAPEIFMAGKRDVASLYEYWVFFQMLSVVEKICDISAKSSEFLVESSDAGGSLRLRSGKTLSIRGTLKRGDALLNLKLSYNRTFSRSASPDFDVERSFPNPGSWTRSMKPDYTISIWPKGMKEKKAELNDKIVHLHFDAKYRVDNLVGLFGDDDAELEGTLAATSAKREDLLKMHAYRDAIRRSGSAFVLYPGSENVRWRAFSELLPGLGAIAMRPTDPAGGAALFTFIEQAAWLVADQFSEDEYCTHPN